MRDKILLGKLREEDCTNYKFFKFLKLLKSLRDVINKHAHQISTKD